MDSKIDSDHAFPNLRERSPCKSRLIARSTCPRKQACRNLHENDVDPIIHVTIILLMENSLLGNRNSLTEQLMRSTMPRILRPAW